MKGGAPIDFCKMFQSLAVSAHALTHSVMVKFLTVLKVILLTFISQSTQFDSTILLVKNKN